ncbi:putative quinol monooxygenase [Actinobacillus vicugnae]|uniref:putative quinol monooxygenase n=1 Tax=Actinobacillus vicugnae TaxID=2573093 RepID=UPI0012428917|nr:antibiotic biosynthesis monooxygenase [Actinobacillus vicugnae]
MKLFKTLATTLAFSTALSVHAAPIFNLFELGVQPTQTERYNQIGENNINASIQNETGTLAMYSVKSDEFHYMVELYADEQAYQTHLQSPQYKAFIEASPEILTEHKKRIALEPKFLGDKKVTQQADTKTNLVMVEVKPEHNSAFHQIVRDEMVQSLKVEEGVLAIYAATEKDNPNRWYFFEIYRNEQAYQQHRNTPHFQTYLNQTAEMLSKNKVFYNITPVKLGNKGGVWFDVLENTK